MRDYDDLYKSKIGAAGWVKTISREAEEWLDGLVDHIKETGREPVWAAVHSRFAELFPDDNPKGTTTISSTVRRRLG